MKILFSAFLLSFIFNVQHLMADISKEVQHNKDILVEKEDKCRLQNNNETICRPEKNYFVADEQYIVAGNQFSVDLEGYGTPEFKGELSEFLGLWTPDKYESVYIYLSDTSEEHSHIGVMFCNCEKRQMN